MKSSKYLTGTLMSALLTAGCCQLAPTAHHRAPAPLPPTVVAEFTCPRVKEFSVKEKELEAKPEFALKRVELTGWCTNHQTNRTLVLDYYAPVGNGKRPVILVLPILGGSYDLEKRFASFFAKRGLAAVIVHRERLPRKLSSLDELDAMLRQTVLDTRQAIDWIETRPEFDAGRIGVFGASMGGIKGALVTPLDQRVRAAVLGLAGGDLPYILTHTTEGGIARRRVELLKEQKLTLPELEVKLRTTITCDPNTFAGYVDPDKVLLVLAACDRVVPIKKGRELRERMGKPETIFLPTGHYTALLCLPYIERQGYKFFQRRFELTKSGRGELRASKVE